MTKISKEDFFKLPIIRQRGVAEIIVDTFEDKPVRLIGFSSPLSTPDIEVYNAGWEYYERFFYNLWEVKLSTQNN